MLAIPINTLLGLQLPANLPAPVLRLARQRHAGRAVKTWARTEGVPAGQTAFCAAGPIETYSLPASDGVLVGAFHLHDDAAHINAPLAENRLRSVFPDVRVHDVYTHDWVNDPYAQGTWLAAKPGQLALLPAFWVPAGRIVFAGGDIGRRWAGWMEGAVISGHDAAIATDTIVGER